MIFFGSVFKLFNLRLRLEMSFDISAL